MHCFNQHCAITKYVIYCVVAFTPTRKTGCPFQAHLSVWSLSGLRFAPLTGHHLPEYRWMLSRCDFSVSRPRKIWLARLGQRLHAQQGRWHLLAGTCLVGTTTTLRRNHPWPLGLSRKPAQSVSTLPMNAKPLGAGCRSLCDCQCFARPACGGARGTVCLSCLQWSCLGAGGYRVAEFFRPVSL